jgi:uncharacterized protein YaiE (UPF0345 family)
MPSSFTTSLRLTLPVTGENSGTWGDLVNTGITNLVDASIAGYAAVTMTDANYTLTSVNGAADEARKMLLNISGTLTAARNVICPTASKLYFIKNATTGGFAITLKTSAGTGISVPNGKSMVLMCDGTNVLEAVDFTTTVNTTNLAYTGTLTGGTGIVNLGSNQFYKDASGNIGVGTTTPTVKLDVIGAGDGGLQYRTGTRTVGIGQTASEASVYWGSTTPLTFFSGSERMRIDSSGNVGIGTASPGTILDVARSQASGTTLRVSNSSIANGASAQSWVQADATDLRMVAWSAATPTLGGTSWLFTGTNTALVLGTNSTERVRIDSSGNVGIGATPSYKLESRAANAAAVMATSGAAGSFVINGVGRTAFEGGMAVAGAPNNFINGTAAGDIAFYNANATNVWFGVVGAGNTIFTTNNTERMRIDSSGNVGIGASNPLNTLHVRSQTSVPAQFTRNSDVTVNGASGIQLELSALNGSTPTSAAAFGAVLDNPASTGVLYFSTRTAGALTEKMRIDSSGNVLVGTTSTTPNPGFVIGPSGFTSTGNDAGASGFVFAYYVRSGSTIGSITQSGTTAVLYNTTSDGRLKTNIVDAADASTLIDSIKVRSFDWISDNSHQRYGMVAQELADVVPEAVHAPADPEEMMAVDYSKLVPLLVKEIQSLRARVAALEL